MLEITRKNEEIRAEKMALEAILAEAREYTYTHTSTHTHTQTHTHTHTHTYIYIHIHTQARTAKAHRDTLEQQFTDVGSALEHIETAYGVERSQLVR
jgi:hypothetical protein